MSKGVDTSAFLNHLIAAHTPFLIGYSFQVLIFVLSIPPIVSEKPNKRHDVSLYLMLHKAKSYKAGLR